MEVKIKYPKKLSRSSSNTLSQLQEGQEFCENNRELIDASLINYVFINPGPELTTFSSIRVPIFNKHPRIVVLYFEFVGYEYPKIEVNLKEVKYHKAYPPANSVDIPNSGTNNLNQNNNQEYE